jgi:hypothetical protein
MVNMERLKSPKRAGLRPRKTLVATTAYMAVTMHVMSIALATAGIEP